METWILLTLFAAFFQNVRTAIQKSLNIGRLSTASATAVRFVYGLPFIILYLSFLFSQNNGDLNWFADEPMTTFLFWCVFGGIGQILATASLLKALSYGSFVVGNTYAKTETMQTALFGLILIGDQLTPSLLLAIVVSFIGVFLLGVGKEKLSKDMFKALFTNQAAFFGVLCGTGFAVAAVSYRAASLSLGWDDAFLSAGTTLLTVIIFQSLLTLTWLAVRERDQLPALAAAWKPGLVTGFAGIGASIGWFTAMTLQSAVNVKALGQIELVFSFLMSIFWFREKVTPTEVAGVLLIVAGIYILIYS